MKYATVAALAMSSVSAACGPLTPQVFDDATCKTVNANLTADAVISFNSTNVKAMEAC